MIPAQDDILSHPMRAVVRHTKLRAQLPKWVKSAVSSARSPCPLLLPSLPSRCIAVAHETGEVEEDDEPSRIGRRQGKSSRDARASCTSSSMASAAIGDLFVQPVTALTRFSDRS